MTEQLRQTWDGHPVSPTPPFGAMIVVYRRRDLGHEFLMLHRRHLGAEYEGPWAWGPPSGARYPGEEVDHCAARELHEETGIEAEACPVEGVAVDWPAYVLEAQPDVRLRLSPEHDRFRWLSYEDALARIEPPLVRDAFCAAVAALRLKGE
jgi:8-oxo-dGTP pyrophosphatase MutT (NUDIX family)